MKNDGINDSGRFSNAINSSGFYQRVKILELVLKYLLHGKPKNTGIAGINNQLTLRTEFGDLKFLGEVRNILLGGHNLEVVLGVKMSRSIYYILENTLQKGAYSVDKDGYLIIPKQADQEKFVGALNRAFGLGIRLLREVECGEMEKKLGFFELQKIKAFWTAAKNILRLLTNALIPMQREGECKQARLVVGRLSVVCSCTLAKSTRGTEIAVGQSSDPRRHSTDKPFDNKKDKPAEEWQDPWGPEGREVYPLPKELPIIITTKK